MKMRVNTRASRIAVLAATALATITLAQGTAQSHSAPGPASTIKNLATSYVLEIAPGETGNRVPVTLWHDSTNTAANLKWTYDPATKMIKNVATGYVLEHAPGETGNRVKLTAWHDSTNTTATNLKWTYDPATKMIKNVATGYVLEHAPGDGGDRAKAYLWHDSTNTTATNLKWEASAFPTVPAPTSCQSWWHRRADHQIESSTNQTPQTIKGTQWTDLDCGLLTLQVPRGQQSMVTVWVNAEIACTRDQGGWCEGRVLADGAELHPATTGDTSRFVWSSAAQQMLFRDGSLIRVGLIKCPAGHSAANCDVKIQVQARTDADATAFWVDDSVVRAEILKTT